MKKESFTSSLPFKLLCALAVGIGVGLVLSAMDGTAIASALLNIIVTVKFITSQFINFCVPLIIIICHDWRRNREDRSDPGFRKQALFGR